MNEHSPLLPLFLFFYLILIFFCSSFTFILPTLLPPPLPLPTYHTEGLTTQFVIQKLTRLVSLSTKYTRQRYEKFISRQAHVAHFVFCFVHAFVFVAVNVVMYPPQKCAIKPSTTKPRNAYRRSTVCPTAPAIACSSVGCLGVSLDAIDLKADTLRAASFSCCFGWSCSFSVLSLISIHVKILNTTSEFFIPNFLRTVALLNRLFNMY